MALTFMMAANTFRDAAEALHTAVSVDCDEFKKPLPSQATSYTDPAGTFKTAAAGTTSNGFQGKANEITDTSSGNVYEAIQKFKEAANKFGYKEQGPGTTDISAAIVFATSAGNFYEKAKLVTISDEGAGQDKLDTIKDQSRYNFTQHYSNVILLYIATIDKDE